MIHLQSFITYLKVSWVKRFFFNLNEDWQNILLTNLKDYVGVRTFSFQKEKLIEISSKFSNLFWKDIFNSLHLAKPYTLINMIERLSLDILNFVPIENAPFISNGKMLTVLVLISFGEFSLNA